jgi:hypothetical protein
METATLHCTGARRQVAIGVQAVVGSGQEAAMGLSTIDLLVGLFDEAFERKAWHGPNLRGGLRGVSASEAAFRPGPGRHNVWEITVHAAYWKYAVRRRLTGEKRGSFALPGSNWFARPTEASEAAWRRDVALLIAEHRALRAEVLKLRPAQLARRAASSRSSVLTLVRGIAAHDLYHAGQIQLLKRLARE